MAVIHFPSSTPLHFPCVSIFQPSGYPGKSVFFPMLVGYINIWGLGLVCFGVFINKSFNLVSPEKWLFITPGLIVLSLH